MKKLYTGNYMTLMKVEKPHIPLQINEKIFCAHGLEVLLKRTKQSTNLVQSCQNSNYSFHRNRTNSP